MDEVSSTSSDSVSQLQITYVDGTDLDIAATKLREQFDMLSQGVFHLPDPWYFENYSNVVANGFFGYFFRSVIVVAISLVLMLMISAFAATRSPG